MNNMSMQPPRLLILKRLLEPTCRAQKTLAELRAKLPAAASESYELQGYFVLCVSALETMLTDTYLYFLRSFPEAFDFKDVQFSKDDPTVVSESMSEAARKTLKKKAADLGLRFITYSCMGDYKDEATTRKIMEFAKDMGAEAVFCINNLNPETHVKCGDDLIAAGVDVIIQAPADPASFKAVAEKYKGDSEAPAKLAVKVRKGGKGHNGGRDGDL